MVQNVQNQISNDTVNVKNFVFAKNSMMNVVVWKNQINVKRCQKYNRGARTSQITYDECFYQLIRFPYKYKRPFS